MQLCVGFFNLALFEVRYSSLLDGMLYRSTIYNSLGVHRNY